MWDAPVHPPWRHAEHVGDRARGALRVAAERERLHARSPVVGGDGGDDGRGRQLRDRQAGDQPPARCQLVYP